MVRSKRRKPVAADSASPSASGLGYRPELDGLRGVAIILVLLAHAFDWPKGAFIGVDMFFALSGFLITTLLLEEWIVHGSISLRDFYLRRYYRLFPALAVMLAVYVAYVLLFVDVDVASRLWGAGFGISYTANLAQAFMKFPNTLIDTGYLWTLGIEEQFYLLWPIVLILLLNRGLGLRGTKWALFGMIVAVVAWRNLLLAHGADPNRAYFGTDTRFDELLVGCLAGAFYVARGTARSLPRWLVATAAVGAGLFLGYRIFKHDQWTTWTVRITLTFIAVATAIVIYSCVTDSFPVLKRALSVKWLVFTGMISYSLYLWHVPTYLFLRDVAGLTGWRLHVAEFALAFAAACASYFLVERTFLKRRRAHQRLRATKAELERDSAGSNGSAGRVSGSPIEPA
ncbi:MAG: acyltransferase [Actinomycetota bacterium]|nr:acyltransferase [Actinomycetota bacterium]